MKITTKLFLLPALLLYAAAGHAQGSNTVEMADGMRSSGKIYVVVVSLLLIFLGLAAYLFITERKIKKLEDQIKDQK